MHLDGACFYFLFILRSARVKLVHTTSQENLGNLAGGGNYMCRICRRKGKRVSWRGGVVVMEGVKKRGMPWMRRVDRPQSDVRWMPYGREFDGYDQFLV